MPSEIYAKPRSCATSACEGRRPAAPALLAALVLCSFCINAEASISAHGTHSDLHRTGLSARAESATAPNGIGISPMRTELSKRVDRAAVEVAGEQMRASLLVSEHPERPILPRDARSLPITGMASTYNPCKPGYASGGVRTASGEIYNPDTWTAAIQIDLRSAFGGVRHGRLYRPAFALVTVGDKSLILRINDVGPLLPGRVIDLNERAMRYFDGALTQGVLPVQVTALTGEHWRSGPLEGGPMLSMAGDFASETIH